MIRNLLVASLLLTIAGAPAPAEAARLLFDQGHGQAFRIEQDGPLQLGEFAGQLTAEGLEVRAVTTPLDDRQLADAAAVVISGPFKPISDAEVASLLRFVEHGGRLAVMLHIASPAWPLLDALKVDVANGVLRERDNVLDGDPTSFAVTTLTPHPITRDLTSFNLYGGWPLRPAAADALSLAASSPRAWVDLNRNDELDAGDASQSFSVIVAGKLGRGEYVVFADDAIFQNRFLIGGNRLLAANLAVWLSRK